MKLYGRTKDNISELSILAETTLVADPGTLRDLASYLYRCADAIEDQGSDWEYEHFEPAENTVSEFVVFNPFLVDL